jgi:Flp pilus assembly protein TadD
VMSPVDAECSFKWEFLSGVAYYRLGELTQSHEHFLRASTHNPTEPAVLNNVGVLTALVVRDVEQAMDYFKKAAIARPGYNDAEWNLRCVISGSRDFRLTPRPLRETLIHMKDYG